MVLSEIYFPGDDHLFFLYAVPLPFTASGLNQYIVQGIDDLNTCIKNALHPPKLKGSPACYKEHWQTNVSVCFCFFSVPVWFLMEVCLKVAHLPYGNSPSYIVVEWQPTSGLPGQCFFPACSSEDQGYNQPVPILRYIWSYPKGFKPSCDSSTSCL